MLSRRCRLSLDADMRLESVIGYRFWINTLNLLIGSSFSEYNNSFKVGVKAGSKESIRFSQLRRWILKKVNPVNCKSHFYFLRKTFYFLPNKAWHRESSKTVLIYIQCVCLSDPPNQCFPAVRISPACAAVWSQMLSLVHRLQPPGFFQRTGPAASSHQMIGGLGGGDNCKVAWGERLLCIGIMLSVPPRAMYFTLHHVG